MREEVKGSSTFDGRALALGRSKLMFRLKVTGFMENRGAKTDRGVVQVILLARGNNNQVGILTTS